MASSDRRCDYCWVQKEKINRCSGCKVIYYCSESCQRSHWDLIHKQSCKKLRKSNITHEEIEDIKSSELVFLSKESEKFKYIHIEFNKMMDLRANNYHKQMPQNELLFGMDGKNGMENNDILLMNTMVSVVINAFDKDGDKKLNYKEWRTMIKIFNLKIPYVYTKQFWFDICTDLGFLEPHEPSLNNGSYGNFVHCPANQAKPILFGPREIVESLRYIAWFFSLSSEIEDEDFMEKFDFYDETISLQKAIKLLFKLYGHAQGILCLGEPSEDDVCDAIIECVPEFDYKEIISLIYDYSSILGRSENIKISWHKIKWYHFPEDNEDFWQSYNRDNGHYDLFYLSKTDEKGYKDIFLNIQICDDVNKCSEKVNKVNESWFGQHAVDMEERINPKERWCLGQCQSYVPNYAFSIKEHAKLIADVLFIHDLNPKLCHYIYIGVGIRMERDMKSKIIEEFNKLYQATTVWRSHRQEQHANPFDIF